MTESIIIAIITVCGTALSAFFGVIVASKMTNFRLLALEEKVKLHNNAMSRILALERESEMVRKWIDCTERELFHNGGGKGS